MKMNDDGPNLESMDNQLLIQMSKVGTEANPISLDDHEEPIDDLQSMLEAARNKNIIQEALFTSQPLDLCFAVIKTTIHGDLPTKQKQLNRAIIKYFKEQVQVNVSCDHFHPRQEPDYSDPETTTNPCELVLYGVDFLTTNSIRDRFTILDALIREIVWINDSTCKLVYGSAEETERVYGDQTKQVKIQQDDSELPRGWFLIKPYTVYSFERLLWMRYANSKETSIVKQNKTFYDKFTQAKKMLGQHLLQKFNAVEQFKKIVNDLDNEKLMDRRSHLSRSRDKFRNNLRFRREFNNGHNEQQGREWRDRREQRGGRNRYQPQKLGLEQVHTTRYAHRPVNMNDSYNFMPNNGSNTRRNNNNNSFQYNPSPKKRYDACDLDSELSFNQFGASNLGRNNEREDFHCDFNYEKQEVKSLQGLNMSFGYQERSMRRNVDKDQSYYMNPSSNKRNDANLSFNFGNNSRANNDFNSSFIVNPNPQGKQQVNNDFFDYLNSVVSSVREANEEEFLDTSFKYDKDTKKSKKNEQNKLLSDSFYHQDSY